MYFVNVLVLLAFHLQICAPTKETYSLVGDVPFTGSSAGHNIKPFVQDATRKLNCNDTAVNSTKSTRPQTAKKRRRRYDYEDVSDWNYDNGKFDYEDETDSKRRWKKYIRNWDKIGLRLIYMGSTIVMVTCCCCLCCRNGCGLVCGSCCHFVNRCIDRCRCRDPMYRKFKTFSEQCGIQLDYETYLNLRAGAVDALAEQGFKVSV